jgi:hypothetical protein
MVWGDVIRIYIHTYITYIHTGIAGLQGAQEISPGTGIYHGGERDAVEGHFSVFFFRVMVRESVRG